MTPRVSRFSLPLLAAGAAALALATGGCKPAAQEQQAASQLAQLPPLPSALPLIAGEGEVQPAVLAPSAAQLPRARELDYGRPSDGDDYAYLDRALSMRQAVGYAPPDYGYDYDDLGWDADYAPDGFGHYDDGYSGYEPGYDYAGYYDDYAGVEPWVWQASDESYYYAEPVDGGWRSYYYAAGAPTPYLVRDPYYSYGYSDGRLVAVYDSYGQALPVSGWALRRDEASRYYAHAARMWRASRKAERRAIRAQRWAAAQQPLVQPALIWARTRDRIPEWRASHARIAPRAAEHWARERAVRRAEAQRFRRWEARDFAGPRPQLVADNGADRRARRAIEQRAAAQRQWLTAERRERRQAREARVEQASLFRMRGDDRPRAGRQDGWADPREARRAQRQAEQGRARFDQRDERLAQREARLAARRADAAQRDVRQDRTAQRAQIDQQRAARIDARRQQSANQRGAQARQQRQAARAEQRQAVQQQRQQAERQRRDTARAEQRGAAQRQQREAMRAQRQTERGARADQQRQAAARQQNEVRAQQRAARQAQAAQQRDTARAQQRDAARAQQQAARQAQMSQQRDAARAHRQAERQAQAGQQRQAERAQQQAARQAQASQQREAARAQQQAARQAQAGQQREAARAQQQAARQAQSAQRQQARAERQAASAGPRGGGGGERGGGRRER